MKIHPTFERTNKIKWTVAAQTTFTKPSNHLGINDQRRATNKAIIFTAITILNNLAELKVEFFHAAIISQANAENNANHTHNGLNTECEEEMDTVKKLKLWIEDRWLWWHNQ